MEEKIKSLKKEAEEITLFLADPNAYMSEDFASKSKRLAEINEIIDIDGKITQLKQNIVEAEQLLDDADFAEIAKSDIDHAQSEIIYYNGEVMDL